NRSILVIAVLAGALGVAGGAGCRRHSQPDDDAPPGVNDSNPTAADTPAADTPAADAPHADAPTVATATAVAGDTDGALPPPPADKVEVQGTAPSAQHHWVT